MDSFFFEVSDKAMGKSGVEQVHEEVQVEEAKLSKGNTDSHECSWVSKLQKDEEMHSLVFSLLE